MHPPRQPRTCRHWYLLLHTGLIWRAQSPGSGRSCSAWCRSCWVQTHRLRPRDPCPWLHPEARPQPRSPHGAQAGWAFCGGEAFPQESQGRCRAGTGEGRTLTQKWQAFNGKENHALEQGSGGCGALVLPLQQWGSERLPLASCRAGHGAQPGKGWRRTGRVAQAG